MLKKKYEEIMADMSNEIVLIGMHFNMDVDTREWSLPSLNMLKDCLKHSKQRKEHQHQHQSK
jgi:hypothetical protein